MTPNPLMNFGNQMAQLGRTPEGVMGLNMLLQGYGQEWDAIQRWLNELGGHHSAARDAHETANQLRQGAYDDAAAQRRRTAEEFDASLGDLEAWLGGRAPEIDALNQQAAAAAQQARAPVSVAAGTGNPFAAAVSQARDRALAQHRSRDYYGRAHEKPGDYGFEGGKRRYGMGRKIREGRQAERGILETGELSARPYDAKSRQAQWQARTTRPQVPDTSWFSKMLGNQMLRWGQRQPQYGGY